MFLTFQKTIIISALALTSAAAISGPTNVPFQATVTITDSIDSSSNGVAACKDALVPSTSSGYNLAGSGMTIGNGNATHLGRMAFVGNDCVHMAVGPYGLPIFYFQGAQGSLVITAANGDKLYGSYSGTFVPTGELPTAEQAKVNVVPYKVEGGQFSIVKGTGRFADAYASGTLSGVESLSMDLSGKGPPSTGTIYLNGKISY
jgi:hypothetical protein